MKRYSLWRLVLSLSVLFLVPIAFGAQYQGPKMVLKEKAFDFQEVKEGDVLEHAFQIGNKGGATLQIEKVKPG